MQARSADTDPEAEKVQIDLLRRAGVARRARRALALSGQILGLARRGVGQTLPGATEEEVALRCVELHYGRALAMGLRRHLAERKP